MHDDDAPANRRPAAEAAVLGVMMLAPACVSEVAVMLTGPDFGEYRHEVIFDAICKLHADGSPTHPVAVSELLMRNGDLNRVGGGPYLHALMRDAPMVAQATFFAEIVQGAASLRHVESLGLRLTQMGGDRTVDASDIPEVLLAARGQLDQLLERADTPADNAPTASAMLEDTIRDIEAPKRGSHIATGLPDLDDFYPGHSGGHLVIIGARPSVGKTIVGLSFARHAVNTGVPTLFVSLEMSGPEIMKRLVAAESGVALDTLTKGNLSEYEWDRIAAASSRILDGTLYIDDNPGQGLPQIRQTIAKIKNKAALPDVGLLVVDYIQLMETPRAENRQQAVSALSRGLKLLAKEFGIPVIALSQLNRASEQRQDKVPVSADLRESGSLEQDADSIILLHREDMHNPENRPNELDMYVPKSRHGRRGKVTVTVQGHYGRVVPYFKAWTPHDAVRGAA